MYYPSLSSPFFFRIGQLLQVLKEFDMRRKEKEIKVENKTYQHDLKDGEMSSNLSVMDVPWTSEGGELPSSAIKRLV